MKNFFRIYNDYIYFSQQQIKEFEQEYEIIIQKDFDEITYQMDKYLENQEKTYKKLHKFILPSISRY